MIKSGEITKIVWLTSRGVASAHIVTTDFNPLQ